MFFFFAARELQHADFSWENHLSYHLDQPRKPVLTSFGDGLPSRIGAYQVAEIRKRNAKQPHMPTAQGGFYRNLISIKINNSKE